MKPLTRRRPVHSTGTTLAVERLAEALDNLAEPVALAALDDPTLAAVADVLTEAADALGRWLTDHGGQVRPAKVARETAVVAAPLPKRPVCKRGITGASPKKATDGAIWELFPTVGAGFGQSATPVRPTCQENAEYVRR